MPRVKEIKNVFIAIAISFLLPLIQLAQNFTTSISKRSVPIGEYFQVSFNINANASNFVAPDFKDFDVYSGPNQSTNMSYVNGVVSQSISLSYYLVGKKEGKFTIGAASINVNGKKLETTPFVVEIVKGNSQQNTNSNQNNTQNQKSTTQSNEYASGASSDEIFVRTFVSKKKCFQGEQLVVTQKVYSRLNIRGFQNYKLPAYNGFWSKEEDRNKQINLQKENVDGVEYFVAEFNKTYLFPQRSGILEIDPVQIEVIASVQAKKKVKSFWDQFFSSGFEDVLFKLKSKAVKINVDPLPSNKGVNSGNSLVKGTNAVGSYTFRAEIDRSKVKENEAINLKIIISGKGNLNLIDNPVIEFPLEFETYDPKINENIITSGGVSGSKTYEYLLIPRKKGNYVIKNFDFNYFDPQKEAYVSIPSPEFNISVEQGISGSSDGAQVYVPANEIAVTENDIRFIKKENLELVQDKKEFFSSVMHYALLVLVIILFTCAVFLRKRIINSTNDIIGTKQKKAAKLARKKLGIAEKFMKDKNKEKFYNEIFIALNKYVSDKFNIPVSELNKEKIQKKLFEKNISSDTTKKLLGALDACEVAKYAPGAVSDNLIETFTNTAELIVELEA